MIKSKTVAFEFLNYYSELEIYDFKEGSIWFRLDGDVADEKPYTINHETEGIIAVTTKEAIDYIYRNRKRINEWLNDDECTIMAKATLRKPDVSSLF